MILTIFIYVLTLLFLLPSQILPEDCQRAIELYDKGTLSNNLIEKERYFKEAIPVCSDPEVLSRVYNNLADLYEMRGEYSRALVNYRKSIETKTDLPTPYFSVGDIFLKLEDYYSAFIMYDKGLRYKPNDEGSLTNRERAENGFRKKMVIYFDLNSFRIPEEYIYRVQLIGELIKKNPDKVRVEVVGYTCDLGTKAYNKKLSRKRAVAVTRYLMENFSLEEESFIIVGKGEDDPLLPSRDKEARTLNRRVEVIIQ